MVGESNGKVCDWLNSLALVLVYLLGPRRFHFLALLQSPGFESADGPMSNYAGSPSALTRFDEKR